MKVIPGSLLILVKNTMNFVVDADPGVGGQDDELPDDENGKGDSKPSALTAGSSRAFTKAQLQAICTLKKAKPGQENGQAFNLDGSLLVRVRDLDKFVHNYEPEEGSGIPNPYHLGYNTTAIKRGLFGSQQEVVTGTKICMSTDEEDVNNIKTAIRVYLNHEDVDMDSTSLRGAEAFFKSSLYGCGAWTVFRTKHLNALQEMVQAAVNVKHALANGGPDVANRQGQVGIENQIEGVLFALVEQRNADREATIQQRNADREATIQQRNLDREQRDKDREQRDKDRATWVGIHESQRKDSRRGMRLMAMMSGLKVKKSDLGSPSSSNSSDSWMDRVFGRRGRGRRSTGSAGSSLPASPVASPVVSTKEDVLGVPAPSGERKPAPSVGKPLVGKKKAPPGSLAGKKKDDRGPPPAPSVGKPLVGKKKAPPGSLAGKKKDDRGPPPVPFPSVGKKKDVSCKICMRMWKDKGVFCNRQGHMQELALWVAHQEEDQDENFHPDNMS